jgi:hypothetical protein
MKWGPTPFSSTAVGHRRPGNFCFGRIPSLQWAARERQDSAQKQTYANLADSSIASAISGISSDGEKPSSAGARTAWASAGRPVDW